MKWNKSQSRGSTQIRLLLHAQWRTCVSVEVFGYEIDKMIRSACFSCIKVPVAQDSREMSTAADEAVGYYCVYRWRRIAAEKL